MTTEDLSDATHAVHPEPIVSALFPDKSSAEQACQAALERGYDPSELNLVMSEETCRSQFADGTSLVKADDDGLAAGTLQAPNGAVVVPGLDLVVAGPLAQGLEAAGVGGVTGGLAGALIGWGIADERVRQYDAGITHGEILLAVKPHNEEDALFLERSWKTLRGEAVQH